MGRISNARSLRLGFTSNWLFNNFYYYNSINKRLYCEEYLQFLCNNFSLKNNLASIFSIIFGKVIMRISKEKIFVCIELYEGGVLNSTGKDIFQKYLLETKLLSLEYLVQDFCFKHYGQYADVQFVFIKKDQISSKFLSSFIEIKLNQGFSLISIISTLKRILSQTKGLLGYRIDFHGRFTRRQRASFLSIKSGRVPFSQISSKLDYHESSVVLKYGKCGFKVWLNVNMRHESA